MVAAVLLVIFGLLGSARVAAQGADGSASVAPAAPSAGPGEQPAAAATGVAPHGAVSTALGDSQAAAPIYPPRGSAGEGGVAPSTAAAAPSAATYASRRGQEYDGPPLLLGRRIAVGGYGGISTLFTQMLDRNGAAVGFEGALLLAHRLSLGFAGYGFTRTPDGPAALDGTERKLGAGYGGFVARYAFLTQLPVYFSVGAIIGGGVVALDDMDDEDWDDERRRNEKSDGFFMVQPELAMHANLTRWMRVGVSGGYRITSNVSRFGLTESDLNGVVLGGNVQFGWI